MNSLDNKNNTATKLKRKNGKPRREVDSDSDQLIQSYFESLKRRRFFGQVVLKIEAGEVVYLNEQVGRTRDELLEALRIEAQATE